MRVCRFVLVGGVAAHHRVHDYACCHLQADCLESGISSGPLCSITSMGNLYLTFTFLIQAMLSMSAASIVNGSCVVLEITSVGSWEVSLPADGVKNSSRCLRGNCCDRSPCDNKCCRHIKNSNGHDYSRQQLNIRCSHSTNMQLSTDMV